MTRRWIAALGCLALGVASSGYLHPQAPQPPASSRAVIDKYCIGCHNKKLKTAGLALDTLDLSHPGDHAQEWEKVVRKFRTGEMPPPGIPRPGSATYTAMAVRLETALDAAAAAKPNPGRVAVHRLNRNEYANAIRDLLGIE